MKKVLIMAVAAALVVVDLVRIELVAKADTPPQQAAPANPGGARQGKAAADAPGTPVPTISPEEMVVAVRIEGNQALSRDKILTKIRTRAQRAYLEEQVQEDVRTLYQMGLVFVRCLKQSVPGGVAVTFQVVERGLLKDVIVLGNDIFPTSILKKEAQLKVGDAADPFVVENSRRRIKEYYQRHGYEDVRVTILEGDKEGDLRAVFGVNEGPPRKAVSVNFIGNHFISAAHLRLYSSAGEIDRREIDEDAMKLTYYYRCFGFFKARVGGELEFDEKQNSLKITFVIHEGPRYIVRNVTIRGNAKIDRGRLAGKLKLLGGQPFDQNQQNLDLQKLRDEYGGDGYVFARVEADNRFVEEPAKLDIVYNIEEGLRYRIGPIKIRIKGAGPHTQDTVHNLLSFKPGDIADSREFSASERRLKATQSFRVLPEMGIEPKIVFWSPASEDDDPAIGARRPKSDHRMPGNAAPLPAGERCLDVAVRAELRKPDADVPPENTP